jgi:hypothetical protein
VKPRIGRRDRRQDESGSLPLKSPPLITQPQAAFDQNTCTPFLVNTYASAHSLPCTNFSLRKCSTAFRHCPRTRGQLQFAPWTAVNNARRSHQHSRLSRPPLAQPPLAAVVEGVVDRRSFRRPVIARAAPLRASALLPGVKATQAIAGLHLPHSPTSQHTQQHNR